MRRSEIFWGGLLVVLGGLFFLKTAGYLTGDVFGWFWPLAIIAAGAWIILGGFGDGLRATSSPDFAIPLQGARAARLTVNHGMGRLRIQAGASGADFLTGNSAAGLKHSARLVDDRLQVELDAGPSLLPFIGPESGGWSFSLNPAVSTEILLNAGASQLELDLSELQVTRLDYEGGASSLQLHLPARVERFRSQISTGASSLDLRLPQGVAARFVITGPGSLSIDNDRFKQATPGVYESIDFATGERRADVTIDGGATSIRVSQEVR